MKSSTSGLGLYTRYCVYRLTKRRNSSTLESISISRAKLMPLCAELGLRRAEFRLSLG